MAIESERGYLIPAINTDSVDYVQCAVQLAKSLKHWHPDAEVCLLTDVEYKDTDGVFDYVKLLPLGDQAADSNWKLSNDWQVGSASPFRQTIKLEADMLITSPVDHWWKMLEHRDVVISTGARTWQDQPAESRRYRQVFDDNNLPDVYNAITYWRVSNTSVEFWRWVRRVFEQWDQYRSLLKFAPATPDTDLVYAVVAVIMGVEQVTLPFATYPKIVHMKRHHAGTQTEDWTKELVWEMVNSTLRINTVYQFGAFHYVQKTWRASEQ